jgi:hypothetical protein
MIKGFEKLLRQVFFNKFPIYLDVRVKEDSGIGWVYSTRNKCYEVFLVILNEDLENVNFEFEEVIRFVRNLAKYMDIEICGVYNNPVSMEEWEEMKSDETP